MGKFYYNDEQESYDAIVVGTGISGGWAAKELCENGLKTLVLERGRMVEHVKDYTTANMDPWDFPNAGEPTKEMIAKQEKQNRTNYTTNAASAQWFVNDLEQSLTELKRILKPEGIFLTICPHQNPLLDFFLSLYTRRNPKEEFGDSRARVSPSLETHFNVIEKKVFPLFLGRILPVYYYYNAIILHFFLLQTHVP